MEVECSEENAKRIINYSIEMAMLKKLKNNNLINETDYKKIEKKIMQQYKVTSGLLI